MPVVSRSSSFPFVGEAAFDRLGLPADDPRRHTVRLANPMSSEEPTYTTTLLPGLLEATARNLGRGASGVALFETGTVAFPVDRGPTPIYGVDWRPSEDELAKLLDTIPDQPLHLAVVLAGERERSGWWGSGRQADWTDAIALVRRLADELGVALEVAVCFAGALASRAAAPRSPSRASRSGHAGELHPQVCRAVGVPARSAAVEIDLDVLMAHAPEVVGGPDFSTYPVAKEDVALVVDASTTSAEVEAALREGAGELLESVRAVRRLHGCPGRRRAASRSPSRCGSAPPTARSPRRKRAPPATPRSPWPPSGAGPSSAS